MAATREEDGDDYSVSSNELHVSLDDLLPLQQTPEPVGDYCVPATTPAFPLHTDSSIERFISANSIRHGMEIKNQTYDKSYRHPEISYPYYLNKNLATKNNLEYYYVSRPRQSSKELSPRWLGQIADKPEHYGGFGRQLTMRRTLDKFAPRNPTPGERALALGWENNKKAVKRANDLSEGQRPAKELTDSAVTQAFPPSRVLITRARTLGAEEFNNVHYRSPLLSAHVRRINEPIQHRLAVPAIEGTRDFGGSFANENEADNFRSELHTAHKKRRNYLNFMTRATCPSKNFGKKRRDETTLPAIHVRPTMLIELTNNRKYGQPVRTAPARPSHYDTSTSGRSVVSSGKHSTLIPKRLPKHRALPGECPLCIPWGTS